ncbi:hypothetical protein H0N98_03265 [Candidatus Micrarchaeota archaeon]|nr:hypothetical protein [Candidatus Micrarchaeota archaeon]
MERDTLIKVFALGMVIFFTLELFSMRSAVTSSPQQANETSNDTPVYGTGLANATLMSYMDYLNLFKMGTDLSQNASIMELSAMEGVGFINNQSGRVTLVLEHGANATLIAQKIEERFPGINVTTSALFSISSEVKFRTQLGEKNVSIPFLLQIETEPDIDVGDNVTVSLVGILYGEQFTETPSARIIPTQNRVVANLTVNGVSDQYYAVVLLPWEGRNINTSRIEGEFPAKIRNASINYTPTSYVAVSGLNSKSNDTTDRVRNLSYVIEVNGDLVYLRDDMNSTERLGADLKGMLGENTTLDYPLSTMVVSFSSTNFSKDDILKNTGGQLNLYRNMSLVLGDKLKIAGVDYDVPSKPSFGLILLNDSYSVGKNVSVELDVGTIGRKIVNLALRTLLG